MRIVGNLRQLRRDRVVEAAELPTTERDADDRDDVGFRERPAFHRHVGMSAFAPPKRRSKISSPPLTTSCIRFLGLGISVGILARWRAGSVGTIPDVDAAAVAAIGEASVLEVHAELPPVDPARVANECGLVVGSHDTPVDE